MEVSDDMQQQAKALGDPSRFRLFRYVAEAKHSVGVAELTELLGFNHNAIRQHLAVLVEAGLVAETDEERTVRGRPRKEYTARQDALSAFGSVSGSYQRLSELLLALAISDDSPYDVGFNTTAGADPVSHDSNDLSTVVHDLARQLTADGFEPEIRSDKLVILSNCPFADVAADAPEVVCEIHRGLIDGHLARHGDFESELSVRKPHRAGCRITLRHNR